MVRQVCQIPGPPTFCREIAHGVAGHKRPNFLEAVPRPSALGTGLAAGRLSASREAFCLSEAKTNKQNQFLDLENVPENPAKGGGGGGGVRVELT